MSGELQTLNPPTKSSGTGNLRFRGDWSSLAGATYQANDLVVYQGVTWVAALPSNPSVDFSFPTDAGSLWRSLSVVNTDVGSAIAQVTTAISVNSSDDIDSDLLATLTLPVSTYILPGGLAAASEWDISGNITITQPTGATLLPAGTQFFASLSTGLSLYVYQPAAPALNLTALSIVIPPQRVLVTADAAIVTLTAGGPKYTGLAPVQYRYDGALRARRFS